MLDDEVGNTCLALPRGGTKTYLARVTGEFPVEGLTVCAKLRVGDDGLAAVGEGRV